MNFYTMSPNFMDVKPNFKARDNYLPALKQTFRLRTVPGSCSVSMVLLTSHMIF